MLLTPGPETADPDIPDLPVAQGGVEGLEASALSHGLEQARHG